MNRLTKRIIGKASKIAYFILVTSNISAQTAPKTIRSVATVGFTSYNRDTNEVGFKSFQENDIFGNPQLLRQEGTFEDLVQYFMDDNNPRYFLNETQVRIVFKGSGGRYLTYDPLRTYFYDGTVNFEYSSSNLLVKVTGQSRDGELNWQFYYDDSGRLITKDVYIKDSFDRDYRLKYKTKFSWLNSKIKSKNVFSGDGQQLIKCLVDYLPYKEVITEETFLEGHKVKTITIEHDRSNQIVKKLIEASFNSPFQDISEIRYSYSNGMLSQINSKRNVFQNNRWEEVDNTTYNIKRDSNGLITSYQPNLEWKYQYDQNGNWIERTQYSIIKRDIEIKTKEQVIKRTISYY